MGGSFDPPHLAHIKIAQAAFDDLKLDEMLFIPAYLAPLKSMPHTADFASRAEMLKIALKKFKGNSQILDLESKRGGTSYSVDTARQLLKIYKNAKLYWIIGADQLENLHKWKDIAKLSDMVDFICFERPKYEFKANENLPANCVVKKLAMNAVDVSSSEIRDSLKKGVKKIDFLDENVLDYINKNKLYI